MYNVYYGEPSGEPLNYYLDEPLETIEEAEEFIRETIKEWWDDHPTMEDEYTIAEV